MDMNSFNYIKKRKDFSTLCKRKEELETLVTILDYKFDVIGLTETKIIKNITPPYDINLKGYKH